MAKRKQQSEAPQSISAEPTTGFLQEPEEPETTAQSIADGVLEDMQKHPAKRKPGRPKKQSDEEELLAEVLPPAQLSEEEAEDEPEEEAQDESQSEATEGDDDNEEPELKDQIRVLAEESGVPLSWVEDAETLAEAERAIQRMYRLYYQEGQPNGHAQQPEPIPAPTPTKGVQTKEEAAEDLDLSDYDEEDKTPKNFKSLKSLVDKQAAKIRELEERQRQREQIESYRAQQTAVLDFQDELKAFPDLFGTDKGQSIAQQRNAYQVYEVAKQMAAGAAQVAMQSGTNAPSIRQIARMAVKAIFADQLAQKQILAKRQAIVERSKRRLGSPSKNGTKRSKTAPDDVYEGDMVDDPFILEGVRESLARLRG